MTARSWSRKPCKSMNSVLVSRRSAARAFICALRSYEIAAMQHEQLDEKDPAAQPIAPPCWGPAPEKHAKIDWSHARVELDCRESTVLTDVRPIMRWLDRVVYAGPRQAASARLQ